MSFFFFGSCFLSEAQIDSFGCSGFILSAFGPRGRIRQADSPCAYMYVSRFQSQIPRAADHNEGNRNPSRISQAPKKKKKKLNTTQFYTQLIHFLSVSPRIPNIALKTFVYNKFKCGQWANKQSRNKNK